MPPSVVGMGMTLSGERAGVKSPSSIPLSYNVGHLFRQSCRSRSMKRLPVVLGGHTKEKKTKKQKEDDDELSANLFLGASTNNHIFFGNHMNALCQLLSKGYKNFYSILG